MKWIIILTIFLCVPFSSLAAATIHVPDDYPTIQQAIDAAFEHDTVIVRPNTYVENINFKGKAITLMSEQGPEGTIIDGDQASSVVTFDSGEGANSILDGFTITNGFSLSGGGGIYCQNSSPTIKNNKITTNFAGYNQPNQSGFGGGMFNVDSNPIVTHCEFSENGAGRGGGMSNFGESSPTVMHCNFIGNNAWWLGGGGMANAKSSTMVSNCAFVENFSGGWWPVAYGG
jgi:hypothetical protein